MIPKNEIRGLFLYPNHRYALSIHHNHKRKIYSSNMLSRSTIQLVNSPIIVNHVIIYNNQCCNLGFINQLPMYLSQP